MQTNRVERLSDCNRTRHYQDADSWWFDDAIAGIGRYVVFQNIATGQHFTQAALFLYSNYQNMPKCQGMTGYKFGIWQCLPNTTPESMS
jgi:hypothetical protein